MSGPALCKTALTLPAIPLLLGAEMAKGEDAETLGGRIARLRRDQEALLRATEAFISKAS